MNNGINNVKGETNFQKIDKESSIKINKIEEDNNLNDTNKEPSIEIIDSSRLKENIIDLTSSDNYNNISNGFKNDEDKEIMQYNENNHIIEEPMTFNPEKRNIQKNKDNLFTFSNSNNSIVQENSMKENINNILETLQQSIDKIQNILKSESSEEQLFIKILEIKNEILYLFNNLENRVNQVDRKPVSKINNYSNFPNNVNNNSLYDSTENRSFNYLHIKDLNNSSYSNNSEINSLNINNDDLIVKMCEVDEIKKIFRTQIVNLKKENFKVKNDNMNLNNLLKNSKTLIDDLSNKNRLLTTKLIKYKTLYEEKQF